VSDDDFLDVLDFVAGGFDRGIKFVLGFVADAREDIDELRSPLWLQS